MKMKHNCIGDKTSEYRQNKGLTQEELAGKIGVTPQALSKWERGQSLPDVGFWPAFVTYSAAVRTIC